MVSMKKHGPGFPPVFSGGDLNIVVARSIRVGLVVSRTLDEFIFLPLIVRNF